MRNWPLFKKIRDKDYKKILKLKLVEVNEGLASNAIHYIDLLIFLQIEKNFIFQTKNEMHI